MNIAFTTVQSLNGSTNVGRIIPLASELTKKGHTVHILLLHSPSTPHPIQEERNIQYIGTEPFRRTSHGKERLRGIRLVFNMCITALRTAWVLLKIKPGIVIISKPLPANVTGVWLYSLLTTHYKLILDTDDFELTANKLSSLTQRAVIHWSERRAAKLAHTIVAASPFLADHFKQLTQNAKPVEVIATGISEGFLSLQRGGGPALLGPEGSDERETIAYLGSISVSSGHRVDLLPEILEKLVARHPTVQLLLAGDGDDIGRLKTEFQQRHLENHVTWHGRFATTDLEQLLSSRPIIIDPIDDSIANRAKSSFRVLLAESRGLPVVTSNIGIRYELLAPAFHDRFFAEPADVDSYVEKISALLQRPLNQHDQQTLERQAGNYRWEKLGERYAEVITSP